MVGLWKIAACTIVYGLSLAGSVYGKSALGSRVLVLYDESLNMDDYSNFLDDMRKRDFDLDLRSTKVKHGDPLLSDTGEKNYDHFLSLAPRLKTFSGLGGNSDALTRFISQGGNAMVLLNPTVSEFWRDQLREFEISVDERDSAYDDRFVDHPRADGVVLVDSPGSDLFPKGKVAYRGIAHKIGASPLLTPVLSGSKTGFSAATLTTDSGGLAGPEIRLVSLFSSKTNGRLSLSGSIDQFSNAFFAEKGSVNREFAADLSKWTFHETHVLHASLLNHTRVGPAKVPETYRIQETIEVLYEVSSWDYIKGEWTPAPASLADLQVELILVTPYIRATLSLYEKGDKNSIFGTQFQLPDRHGVYTLQLDYRRPTYTFLLDETVFSVTPLRHDEYERFINEAYPWYAGAIAVSVGFLIFSLLWVMLDSESASKKKVE